MVFWAKFWGNSQFVFTQFVVGAITVLLVILINKHITRTNRSIAQLLFALKHNDYSQKLPTNGLNSFNDLHTSINTLLQQQENKSLQVSEQLQELESVLALLPFPIFTGDSNQKLVYQNELAAQLLNKETQSKFWKHLSEEDSNSQKSLNLNDQQFVAHQIEFKTNRQLRLFCLIPSNSSTNSLEAESWVKILRVLMHEFLNGAAAIITLTNALSDELKNVDNKTANELTQRLSSRSEKIYQFASTYQSLSNISAPDKTWFSLEDIVAELTCDLNVKVEIVDRTNGNSNIFADQLQIQQVFDNLLLNAEYALKNTKNPIIKITIENTGKSIQVLIEDNGPGIPSESLNQIFVPFYSTRKDGQGIGLSLSRLIMRNNKGKLFLKSSFPGETIFGIRFN